MTTPGPWIAGITGALTNQPLSWEVGTTAIQEWSADTWLQLAFPVPFGTGPSSGQFFAVTNSNPDPLGGPLAMAYFKHNSPSATTRFLQAGSSMGAMWLRPGLDGYSVADLAATPTLPSGAVGMEWEGGAEAALLPGVAHFQANLRMAVESKQIDSTLRELFDSEVDTASQVGFPTMSFGWGIPGGDAGFVASGSGFTFATRLDILSWGPSIQPFDTPPGTYSGNGLLVANASASADYDLSGAAESYYYVMCFPRNFYEGSNEPLAFTQYGNQALRLEAYSATLGSPHWTIDYDTPRYRFLYADTVTAPTPNVSVANLSSYSFFE